MFATYSFRLEKFLSDISFGFPIILTDFDAEKKKKSGMAKIDIKLKNEKKEK